jgi:hypothetical protein
MIRHQKKKKNERKYYNSYYMQACDFKVEGPLLADHQNLTGSLHPCVALVRRALKSPCDRIRGGLKSTSWWV